MENDVPYIHLLGKTYLTNNEKFYIRNDAIIHMAAGDRHTIIVTESGRVFAFGDNNSGQLGLGHTNNIEKVSCIRSLKFGQTGEKVILAACGRESSLVATNQGFLYAFGSNHRCQLGIESEETTTIYPHPIKIEYFHSKMSWKQLSMGAEHTCVLTNQGKVYVWGSNEDDQCGQAHRHDIIRTPRELKLDYPVIAISCGYYHTALISEDGRLFLFGNNSNRQLGRSISDQYIGPFEVSLPDPIQAVACGNQHTVVLTEKGDVYTCGQGDRGQLGLGRRVSIAKQFKIIKNLSKHVTAIAAGEGHTAIVDSLGDVYIFGDGKYGKLSGETNSNEFEPCLIDKFKEYNIFKIVCGGCQTIILAQKRTNENDEEIENTASSKTKPIKNTVHIKHKSTITNCKNTIDASLQDVESSQISNRDELSTETIHRKIQSTTFRLDNKDFQPIKSNVLGRAVSLDTTKDNLTKSIHQRSSKNRSSLRHTRLSRRNTKNNLRKKQTSDDEKSSSNERSLPVSKKTHPRSLSVENKNYQILSSTTSGCTSSSVSSIHNENQTKALELTDDLQNSSHPSTTKTLIQPDITNSNIDPTKTVTTIESPSGLFSRFFGKNSSQKLPTTTNKNSRTCSIM